MQCRQGSKIPDESSLWYYNEKKDKYHFQSKVQDIFKINIIMKIALLKEPYHKIGVIIIIFIHRSPLITIH